jgi:response regulator RpfG family c-di-GMP phosphodiesterase
MPGWAWLAWPVLALGAWTGFAGALAFVVARALSLPARHEGEQAEVHAPPRRKLATSDTASGPVPTRILVVEDDAAFRSLLATTLAADAFELAEAASVEEARTVLVPFEPHVVLLDVSLPGVHGLVLCAELRELEHPPGVVLLTGTDVSERIARSAGAEAVLRKPFSPLALLQTIDRLASAGPAEGPARLEPPRAQTEESEQLMVYARDLARVVEVEQTQRRLLENAYRQTVTAFASALEARDTGTNVHSLRVTRFALELAAHARTDLLEDPSLVYGLLLHDIGKIGVPDSILLKQGPLDPPERGLMQRHPEIGEQILREIAMLQGEGLRVVRSHHERWDGGGYPEGLAGEAIPLGARVCAVADTLEALTNDRPYRRARDWSAAIDEIVSEAGGQFDPDVVDALLRRERAVRTINEELARAA